MSDQPSESRQVSPHPASWKIEDRGELLGAIQQETETELCACRILLVCTVMIASCATSDSVSHSSGDRAEPRTAGEALKPSSQGRPGAAAKSGWDRMALDAKVLALSDACAFSYVRLNHPRSYTVAPDESDLAAGAHAVVEPVDCHGLPIGSQAVLVTVQNIADETVGVPLQLSRIYLDLPDKTRVRASAVLTSIQPARPWVIKTTGTMLIADVLSRQSIDFVFLFPRAEVGSTFLTGGCSVSVSAAVNGPRLVKRDDVATAAPDHGSDGPTNSPEAEWNHLFAGSGPVRTMIANESDNDLMMRIKDAAEQVVARVRLSRNDTTTLQLPHGVLTTLIRLERGGVVGYYRGPEIQVPPSATNLRLVLQAANFGNLTPIDPREFER
jgi:hypothetical protein